MTWTYRVIRQRDDVEEWLGIHEVYDIDNTIGWTPVGVTGSTIDDLRETLERMLACLDRPIINE